MSSLSYPETGATRLGPLPDGYHHLHHRTRVGRGRADFEAAGAAITDFRMHRLSGARVRASAPRAEPGAAVRVALGAGPFRFTAPCQVIWAEYGPERIGFAYGTLTRHPECGEECFVAELADDGTVSFTVLAFSRHARWYTRIAGPFVPVAQRWYARRLGRTLRRIVAEGRESAGR
ncbi:DUF1990 family protein [Streptomyces sp. NBC_01257]|uniref:DUF1990 family protein n=1 Tax=Streptomyces sp. NBC_01257 TaxID=2903799 RepID=UPI002DD92FE6|nr:DUF1990 domain-containing protein [Streptomyces sp. NBC_01257]WRZ68993.1 DUF1990 domain-containing protein [Streptomyces sp. NBC_01257]